MFELPDFDRAWDFENGFYLTCDTTRMAKALAHYELFRLAQNVSGAIVECGVFKGASLARFAMFRQLFGGAQSKQIVAFDTFDQFPETAHEGDKPVRERFVQAAGSQSISVEQLREVLERKGCGENVELIAGNICETVPNFAAEHPDFRIALLNLDTDVYEPAKVILEYFWPLIVPGGVLLLDDYNTFPGETQAVDEYFAGQAIEIRKFPFAATPSYIVKTRGGQ